MENSAGHSRRTSFMHLPHVISQHTPNESSNVKKNYYDFINEVRAASNYSSDLHLQSVSDRPSLAQLAHDRGSLAPNTTSKKQPNHNGSIGHGLEVVNEAYETQVPLTVRDSKRKNEKPVLVGYKAETLKRFEKLIKETQQSDEGSLLKHI